MATKIGFQLNPNRFVFDPSKELDDFVDTIGQQEKDRETQRQKWRDEQDEFYKSANELKATPNQQANEFFGKWSGGLMSEATELQYQLENGRIDSRDYSAQFRNLLQSNEQMIGAQKNYQANAQRIVDGVADDSLSQINSMAFVEYNKALELGAIEVESDGRGGFKLFNKNTGKVYNPYQLSNLTTSNVPKFDPIKAAATAVIQFGKRGIKDEAGNTIKGVYANMPGVNIDELMDAQAIAMLEGNQARIASLLVDSEGYDVVYDEKDLVDKDGNLKEKTFLRNQDGTFTFTEADEAAAVNEMKTALKNALPKDIEERQALSEAEEKTFDQAQQRINVSWETLKQRKLEFGKADRDKMANANTQVEIISTLYSGDPTNIKAALEFYRDYGGKNNIKQVKRNAQGIEVIFQENEYGETQSKNISFFVADSNSDTDVPNPDFDPNKEESDTNPRLVKGRQKSESQFINSASQLLTGKEFVDMTKVKSEDGTFKYDRPLTDTDEMEASVIIEESPTTDVPETYNVSADEYFDGVIKTVTAGFSDKDSTDQDLGNRDQDLAKALNKEFKDLGLLAIETGGLQNKVVIRIPGVTKTITIDTNNYTVSSDLTETQKLREFITNAIKRRPDLQEKLNLTPDVKTKRGGKTAKYNDE